jgi:nicotinamide riboside kinase
MATSMSKTIISISGPESSGKTSLAIALAQELGCAYIPEIARFYLKDHGEYSFEDVEHIANLQLEAVRRAKDSSTSNFMVLDSDHVVLEIWFQEKFNRLPSNWDQYKAEWGIDLHVLCSPDIPWEEDPLRENPFDRDRLFQRYHERLELDEAKFMVVDGLLAKRLKAVLERLSRG